MHYEECSDVNAMVDWIHSEDDVVRAWYLLYIVWPLYIFLVVITSAFSLFFLIFLLQALLSALCLKLNLDRMYSFNLQWKWNNDKIRMVNKPFCVCLYWHSCVKPYFRLFPGLQIWQRLLSSGEQGCILNLWYIQLYTTVWNINMKQFIHKIILKIFRHLTLEKVQMNVKFQLSFKAYLVNRNVLYCDII